ncbi:hypothetical protein LTR74_018128 [Friedmanniomyces endolithicus]|nr:hypothetical protein LTR74_018128 [Friedmanniomyces endolithicus]
MIRKFRRAPRNDPPPLIRFVLVDIDRFDKGLFTRSHKRLSQARAAARSTTSSARLSTSLAPATLATSDVLPVKNAAPSTTSAGRGTALQDFLPAAPRPVLSQAAPTTAALNGIYSSGPAKCADREPTPPTSEIGCSPSIIYGDMLAECTLIDHASLQVDSEPMHALTRNSIGDDMALWTSTRFNDSQDAGSVREWTTNDTTASSPAPYTSKRSSMPSVARDFSLEDLVNGTVAHQPLAESLNDYPTLGYEPIACNADLEPRHSPTHSDDDYIGRRRGSPDEGLTDDMSNTPPTTTQISHITSPTEVSQPQRTPSNEHSPKARACCRYDQRSAARNLEPCSREKALLDVDVRMRPPLTFWSTDQQTCTLPPLPFTWTTYGDSCEEALRQAACPSEAHQTTR